MGDSESPKSTMRFLIELVEIVLIAFALSWVLRTYVIEARKVPTGSMLPTIQLEDRVIVDKFFFKNFLKFIHLRLYYIPAVHLVWIGIKIVLMIIFGNIKMLQRFNRCDDRIDPCTRFV